MRNPNYYRIVHEYYIQRHLSSARTRQNKNGANQWSVSKVMCTPSPQVVRHKNPVGSVIVVPSCPLGLNGPVLVPDHSRDQEHATWGRPGGVGGRCGTVWIHTVPYRPEWRKTGSGGGGRGPEAAFLGVNFTGGVPQGLRGGWLGSGSYPPAGSVMGLCPPGQTPLWIKIAQV